MASKKKNISYILNKVVKGILSIANYIGTAVIQAVLWIGEVIWWIIKSLVLLIVALPSLFKKNKTKKTVFKKASSRSKATNPLLKPFADKNMRRKLLPGLVVVLLFLVGFAVYSLRQAEETEAHWWDETWLYRRAIQISNDGSAIDEFRKIKIEIDTETIISNGKLQNDCADARFTDNKGNIIRYFIDSNNGDCNTSTTHFYFELPSIIAGDQVVYFYYGNQTANSNASAPFFVENSLGNELLNYWRLDEDSGSIADDTGTDNPGTITGASVATGIINNARNFSDSTEYIEATNRYDSLSALSISFWIWRPSTTDIYYHLLGNNYNHAASSDGFRFLKRNASTNNLQFRVGKGGTLPIVSVDSLPIEQWAHVVGTFAGANQLRLYIDGAFVGSANTTITDTGISGEPFRIHRNPAAEHGVPNTKIDEVMIYSRVITDSEIEQLYNNGNGISFGIPTFIPSSGLTLNTEEISPGPVAYWKFDEGTGTTAHDSSGQGNDGTLINSPTWQTEDLCVSGKCLEFDGSTAYISTSNPSLKVANVTMQAWIKISDIPDSFAAVIFKNPSSEDYRIQFNPETSQLNTRIKTTSSQDRSSGFTNSLPLNEWVHVAGTYDGNTVAIYINGSLANSQYYSAYEEILQTDTILTIGRQKDVSGRFFPGFIDEVKIYPYARTEDQIKADYAAGLAGMGSTAGTAAAFGGASDKWLSDGLVGYWKMDEASWDGTADEVIDASGNGNHGVAVNGATTGAGVFGNGGLFDGVDDYVNADMVSQISDKYTASAWIYPTRLEPQAETYGNTILATSSNYGIWLLHNNGAIRIHAFSSSTARYYQTTATPITLNKWHHIVVTAERNGEGKIFVDGELIENFTAENDTDWSGVFGIGDLRLDRGLTHQGAIDEVRIYNRALSPAEVRALYEWAPGPVAHYTFDDSSDSSGVADISGYGNNGTWYGSSTQRYGAGKYGSAGSFNGGSDYLDITDNSSLRIDDNFTIGMWVKPASGASGHFISKRGPGNIFVGIRTSDVFVRDANSQTANPSFSLDSNQWQYLSATKEGTTVNIYKNGVKVNSVTNESLGSVESTGNLQIGGETSTSRIETLIDDVRIYNYARTQKQILEDMAGSIPGQARMPQPLAHWRFDEGYGTTAHDSIGDNNGTINGASWTNEGRVGRALSFDGDEEDDYVSVNLTNANLSGSQTLTAWIKPNGPTESNPHQTVISTDTTYQDGIALMSYKNFNRVSMLIGDGDNYTDAHASVNLNDGSWHFVAGIYDYEKGEAWFFIDGNIYPSTIVGQIDVNVDSNGAIGRDYHESSYSYNGLIDEVKIYNYALSPEEVALDYNQGMSAVMGAAGTDDTGAPSSAASAQYCIPGDDSHCAPPVAEWLFNENQGTVARDTSDNGNDGTLVNMDNSNWTAGADGVGGALRFDGSNEYVDTNSPVLSGKTFSIDFWINHKGYIPTNRGTIISQYNVSASGRLLYWFDNGQLQLGGDISNRVAHNPLTNDGWYHTSIVFSDGSAELFFNGASKGNIGTLNNDVHTSDNTFFGGTYDTHFNGLIDQVRIYDYARTPAQIAWDYNRGAPVGHWRFDECQGTTAHDVSGNENHGTINIGASGTQTSAGTCTSGNSVHAWYNGREGRINSAMSFDGTDDYVEVQHDSSIAPPLMSAFLWVNSKTWDKTTATSFLAKRTGGASGYFFFVLTSTKTVHVDVNNVTQSRFNTGYTPPLNQWVHLGYTYDGHRIKFYVNGILNNTSTDYNKVYELSESTLQIGREHEERYEFSGLIDDVRIYNYALTDEQVKLLYNDGAVSFR
jgi:hypothetical protein